MNESAEKKKAKPKTSAPLLQVEALSMCWGVRVLFEPLNFSLYNGEIMGIQGPSGVGKTSLLRGIATLSPTHSGRCTFQGKSPESWGIPAYRREVIWIAQRPTIFAASVEENLKRPFRYQIAEAAYDAQEARFLLDRLGMQEIEFHQAATALSEGEKQRLCLVRALLLKPSVLLLDEPTSALDRESIQGVEELLGNYVQQENRAVLLISHDHEQLKRVCCRSLQLNKA